MTGEVTQRVVAAREFAEGLVGTSWAKPMPQVGVDPATGAPVVGTATVNAVWMQDGEWFVDYFTTFPGTSAQGYGMAEAGVFVARRTRVGS